MLSYFTFLSPFITTVGSFDAASRAAKPSRNAFSSAGKLNARSSRCTVPEASTMSVILSGFSCDFATLASGRFTLIFP